MSSNVIGTISIIGSVITHPTIFVTMLKYIFKNGWSYPFFSILFLNAILFLLSVIYFLYKLAKHNKLNDPMFYLPGSDYILLAIPYSGYIVCSTYAIFDPLMNSSRYLMLSPACDFFWMGIWSTTILQRALTMHHWIGFILAFGGYTMYDFLIYHGEWQLNWSIEAQHNWQGPVFCLLSRAFFIMSGTLSKRMLLKRGFAIKLAQHEQKMKKKELEKLKWKDLELEALDDKVKNFKKKRVKHDSMIYKRSMIQKRMNLQTRKDELKEIKENLAVEKKKLTKKEKELQEKLMKRRHDLKDKNEISFANNFITNSRIMRVLQQIKLRNKNINNDIKKEQFPDIIEKERRKTMELRKEQEELKKILQEEQHNHVELETMLNDYNEVGFHMHLFSGDDDIVLTKIDYIIDNAMYDNDLIGISEKVTFELYSIGGSLALFPIAYLFAFFNNEVPIAFNSMAKQETIKVFGGNSPLFVASGFSLLFALRPYFLHKMVFTTTHEFYFILNSFSHFFILVYSTIFVDTESNVPSTHGAGILIVAFAYGFYFYGVSSYIKSMESISNMEALKTMMPSDLKEDQIERLELKMMDIQNVLGDDTLHRVMLDTAISRNPNGLSYTANPVLNTRVLFDKDYFSRIADWGGGYPRPFVEIIEETWRAKSNEKGLDLYDAEFEELLRERERKLKMLEEKQKALAEAEALKERNAIEFIKRKKLLEEYEKRILEVMEKNSIINDLDAMMNSPNQNQSTVSNPNIKKLTLAKGKSVIFDEDKTPTSGDNKAILGPPSDDKSLLLLLPNISKALLPNDPQALSSNDTQSLMPNDDKRGFSQHGKSLLSAPGEALIPNNTNTKALIPNDDPKPIGFGTNNARIPGDDDDIANTLPPNPNNKTSSLSTPSKPRQSNDNKVSIPTNNNTKPPSQSSNNKALISNDNRIPLYNDNKGLLLSDNKAISSDRDQTFNTSSSSSFKTNNNKDIINGYKPDHLNNNKSRINNANNVLNKFIRPNNTQHHLIKDPFIPQPIKISEDIMKMNIEYANSKNQDGEFINFSKLKRKF